MREDILMHPEMWSSFFIEKDGRVSHCDSAGELETALAEKGLPSSLAVFEADRVNRAENCIVNRYGEWSVTAYPPPGPALLADGTIRRRELKRFAEPD